MLRDVRVRDLSVTVQGDKVKVPIGISPCAMHKMAHEDGECASARGNVALLVFNIFSINLFCSCWETWYSFHTFDIIYV